MVWNVFRYNISTGLIEEFNIFNHCSFSEKVQELLKESTNKDAFAEELKRFLTYYFWSKFEYEICVSSLFSDKEESEKKVDIYSQVMLNYDSFVDYAWSHRKCKICSADYHQGIVAGVERFHTSSNQEFTAISVEFCPACGRRLSNK